MKQIVYKIVVFLHLMGYRQNPKIDLLTDLYKDKLSMENKALIDTVDSLITELDNKNVNKSIINNLENYKEEIVEESKY